MRRLLLGPVPSFALVPAAHAAGVPRFLPVVDSASRTIRGEPAPRTIQHLQPDDFSTGDRTCWATWAHCGANARAAGARRPMA